MSDPCDILTDSIINSQTSNVLPELETPGRQYDCQTGPRFKRERAREQIAETILLFLGAPVIELELDKQQVSMAINEALKFFEMYAPSEYWQWFHFHTVSHQSVYQLPCDIGFIRDVKYDPATCDGATELGGSMPLGWIGDTGYGAGGLAWGAWGYNTNQAYWGYAGEWALFKSYEDMFARMSSRNGGWEYFEDSHSIKIYPTPHAGAAVVSVQYVQKRKDFAEVHQLCQEYALALCKIMLGRIRSKYTAIVGPDGSVSLDGPTILEEGKQEKLQLEKDAIYKWNDPVPIVIG